MGRRGRCRDRRRRGRGRHRWWSPSPRFSVCSNGVVGGSGPQGQGLPGVVVVPDLLVVFWWRSPVEGGSDLALDAHGCAFGGKAAGSGNVRRSAAWHPEAMALHCLIVDDSPRFVEAARGLLEREGIVVLAKPARRGGLGLGDGAVALV